MAKNTLVTLMTDFGTSDPYVAAIKGTILRLCPRAQIVDLCHEVPAHNVPMAAFILAHSAPHFPADTLHVIVVDPTVGTERRILAARIGGQFYLFPDNGVISRVVGMLPLQSLHIVRNTSFLPSPPSATFHGRDVFAPVAAQILNGLDISRLGPQPDKYTLLEVAAPVIGDDAIVGQVVYIDRFDNIVSNISAQVVSGHKVENLRVFCAGKEIGPIVRTYAAAPRHRTLALINSMGLVEVAVNQGRAAHFLGAALGDEVRITWK
jgi:S-adenosyl-L-methionine hydrolase (adenosine-forming)